MHRKYICYMMLAVMLCFIVACGNTADIEEMVNEAGEISASEDNVMNAQDDNELVDNTMNNIAEYEYLDIEFEEGELYTDPMLMNPAANSIEVVWFTNEPTDDNKVLLYDYGADNKPTRCYGADSYKLTRMRGGDSEADKDLSSISRDIYRHSAVVEDLPINDGSDEARVAYRVCSDGVASNVYYLKALAMEGVPQRILLTSDYQVKNMCAANAQKIYETVGDVDFILANGDLADIADRAYDWFDSDNAYFRVMQGRGSHEINGVTYTGGPLLQNAPIYTAIGNHEVMGPYGMYDLLPLEFNYPITREFARELYNESSGLSEEEFVNQYSFNTVSYEELFSLPSSESGDERYYTFTNGDVAVIVLEVARIWRVAGMEAFGTYNEEPGSAASRHGFGRFIFEPISEGSPQLDFLENALNSEEFQNAKYRIVMYHFDNHSLGGNCIPAYTDPVSSVVKDPVTGSDMIIYDYPKEDDYLANYVEPMLEAANVNLVFVAHSHIWCRFATPSGMNYLQSSNTGNTYDCFTDDTASRTLIPDALKAGSRYQSISGCWNSDNYVLTGDPGDLEPIMPTNAQLPDGQPFLASNTITAFSILDTGTGTVDSYYYDTENPDSEVVLFDSFSISN